MTYSEKLKDPRWQKKRLQVLDRDKWTCQGMACFEKEKTLHVHHLDYVFGNDPWDYPDHYFLTLCETCHAEVSAKRKAFEERLVKAFRLGLHDTFIQRCAAEVFETKNLHELIYMLWDIKHNPGGEERLLELLAEESVSVKMDK